MARVWYPFKKVEEKVVPPPANATRWPDRYYIEDGWYKYTPSKNRLVAEESDSDFYHKLTPGERNRLDIVSHTYYNTHIHWSTIAEVNEIPNPLRTPLRIDLRLLPLSRIFSEVITLEEEDA